MIGFSDIEKYQIRVSSDKKYRELHETCVPWEDVLGQIEWMLKHHMLSEMSVKDVAERMAHDVSMRRRVEMISIELALAGVIIALVCGTIFGIYIAR